MDALAITIDTTATYTRLISTASGTTHATTISGRDLADEITNFLAGGVYDTIAQALQDTITLVGRDVNGDSVTFTYTK